MYGVLLVCYWTLAISDDQFAHAGTHCNPVLQDNRPLSQAPIKIRKAHSVTGNNFCVSEAPAQELPKSATTTQTDPSEAPDTAADKPSSHLVGLVTSAAKAAAGAQKQRCSEYDCSHSCSARRASASRPHDDHEQ